MFPYNSTEKSELTWLCDCSMEPLLPPLLWATPLACNISFQTAQLWDSSKPQLLMIHPTFSRFGLLRVSLRSVGAAPGPCDLSINAFTIFRSTSCFSFENPALASSDSNTICVIHTHPWCSFQPHPDWCSLLFFLCHLSKRKCFANSAQFITSCLLNPSSNSLSPACSQCKHINAHLFASALWHIANELTLSLSACLVGCQRSKVGEQDRFLNTGEGWEGSKHFSQPTISVTVTMVPTPRFFIPSSDSSWSCLNLQC